MIKRLVIAGLAGVVLATLIVGGALWWGAAYFSRPLPIENPTTVLLERGIGVKGISQRLADAGIVDRPLVFRAGVRLMGVETRLKAGEYLIEPGATPRDVVDLLVSGKTVVHRLTIPEGLTTAEILDRIAADPVLEGPVPDGIGEGELLPETYHFHRGETRGELVARMKADMEAALQKAWSERPKAFPLKSVEELLILASIVEKETALAEERPEVAAVFLNRLKKGMRLQSDPTVAYGLSDGDGSLDRPLTRADLASDHPYNTYRIDALPPGPIATPGVAAIEAVVHPADSDALYFVADGSGGHAFARTLKEHNRNVRRWRAVQRERRAGKDG